MHLKKLGLAAATSLMMTCGLVSAASATTIDPPNTAVTLTSTNSHLTVDGSGAGAINCGDATISGTTPAHSTATWQTVIGTTTTFSNCTAFGFVTAVVTPSEGCHTTATAPRVDVMGVNSATALATITIPVGCDYTVSIPSTGCDITITGGQSIGNLGAGPGGIDWTNLPTKSVAHLNTAIVPSVDSNGVGFGCPAAGAHTGTLGGDYTITSATNVTVTP